MQTPDGTTVARGIRWRDLPCWLVIAAASLGGWLRVEHLARKSHWEDEFWTVERTDEPYLVDVVGNLRGSPFPPLHYVLAWCWQKCLHSNSVPTIRWISAVWGLAAIPVTFVAWRRVLSVDSAKWATAFVSVSSFHIWYSRDAKMYAAVWLLATLSCGTYLSCIFCGSRWKDRVMLGASNGCLLMTSYIGVVVLALQGLHGTWSYIRRPERRRAVLYSLLATMVGCLPFALWSPSAYGTVAEKRGIVWISPIEVKEIPADVVRLSVLFLSGIGMGDFAPRNGWGTLFLAVLWPLLSLTTALVLGYTVQICRRQAGTGDRPAVGCPSREQTREVFVFLVVWLVAPVAGAIAFSLVCYPVWCIPRYLISAAPALMLLLGISVSEIRPTAYGWTVGVVVLCVNLMAQMFDRECPTRVPWEEVTRTMTVATEIDPGLAEVVDAGQPVDVAYFGLDGIYFDHFSLKHAMRPGEQPWAARITALYDVPRDRPRQGLIVLTQASRAPTVPAREVFGWFLKRYDFVSIYRVDTFEDEISRLPTPFQQTTTEIWLGRPRRMTVNERTEDLQKVTSQ